MGSLRRVEISSLRGAEYNPRAITKDALQSLKDSISTIGFAKPVITTADGLIIAGHQRTKAATAMGLNEVPAWVLSAPIGPMDEVKFNQLHNGTDLDFADEPIRVPPRGINESTFIDIEHKDITCTLRSSGAVLRAEICKLVLRYGPWGCAVVTDSGDMLSGQQYALSCVTLGIPCRVFRVRDDLAGAARSWFGQKFGEFSYDHLPRNPWIQSFAQPFRLRGNENKRDVSVMYEQSILPALKPGERLLDFGCGQGDYVKQLRKSGAQAFGVEFFRRAKGSNALDTGAVHRMVDETLAEYRKNGGFDVVVVDSVITSVQDSQAEADVLRCAAAFGKIGARVYIACRRRERLDGLLKNDKCVETQARRYIEFLDADGASALLRHGEWFFQRFHTREQLCELLAKHVGRDMKITGSSGYWQSVSVNERPTSDAETETSLFREFNLAWPENGTVGRGDAAVSAWRDRKDRP